MKILVVILYFQSSSKAKMSRRFNKVLDIIKSINLVADRDLEQHAVKIIRKMTRDEVNQVDNDGRNLFFMAATRDILMALVEAGIDTNHVCDWGQTALMYILDNGATVKRERAVRILDLGIHIACTQKINQFDKSGLSALMYSVGQQYPDCITRRILNHPKLVINAENPSGESVIHYIMEIAQLRELVEHGATGSSVDEDKQTLLFSIALTSRYVYWSKTWLDEILNIVPDLDIRRQNVHGENILMRLTRNQMFGPAHENALAAIDTLIRLTTNINERDHSGRTVLMHAFDGSKIDIIKKILDVPGVDLSTIDYSGKCVASYAVAFNRRQHNKKTTMDEIKKIIQL